MIYLGNNDQCRDNYNPLDLWDDTAVRLTRLTPRSPGPQAIGGSGVTHCLNLFGRRTLRRYLALKMIMKTLLMTLMISGDRVRICWTLLKVNVLDVGLLSQTSQSHQSFFCIHLFFSTFLYFLIFINEFVFLQRQGNEEWGSSFWPCLSFFAHFESHSQKTFKNEA